MNIDKSGKWWVGKEPNDIKEYLEAYSAEGYGSQAFRQAKCTCGGETFALLADDDEGCAKRICTFFGTCNLRWLFHGCDDERNPAFVFPILDLDRSQGSHAHPNRTDPRSDSSGRIIDEPMRCAAASDSDASFRQCV